MLRQDAQTPNYFVLTSGGPAPGLNAAIHCLTTEAEMTDIRLTGILDGPAGLMTIDKNFNMVELNQNVTSLTWDQGGTMLGTSRFNLESQRKQVKEIFQQTDFQGGFFIGGNDSARSALVLEEEGIQVNLIPKTIDGDLPYTETFGPETFVTHGVELVNNCVRDALSTKRLYVIEIMGRDSGLLTFRLFKASRAIAALIPEEHFSLDALDEFFNTVVHPYGCLLICEGAKSQTPIVQELVDEKVLLRQKLLEAGIPQIVINSHLPLPIVDDYGNLKKGGIAGLVSNWLETKIEDGIVQEIPSIGYQLRSANPVPYDIDLAIQTSRHAFREMLAGNHGILAAKPRDFLGVKSIPLSQVVDAGTVSLSSEEYEPYLIEGGILVK